MRRQGLRKDASKLKDDWVNTHTCKVIPHHMLIIYWMSLHGL